MSQLLSFFLSTSTTYLQRFWNPFKSLQENHTPTAPSSLTYIPKLMSACVAPQWECMWQHLSVHVWHGWAQGIFASVPVQATESSLQCTVAVALLLDCPYSCSREDVSSWVRFLASHDINCREQRAGRSLESLPVGFPRLELRKHRSSSQGFQSDDSAEEHFSCLMLDIYCYQDIIFVKLWASCTEQ